jgi:hypothetical protein
MGNSEVVRKDRRPAAIYERLGEGGDPERLPQRRKCDERYSPVDRRDDCERCDEWNDVTGELARERTV